MLSTPINFDDTMRELFEYPDPSFPFVVWSGDFQSFVDKTIVCHWHKEFEYGVLLSGELDYYIDGQHIHAQKGEAVFINSNVIPYFFSLLQNGSDTVPNCIIFLFFT